jgi:hypothetical protein
MRFVEWHCLQDAKTKFSPLSSIRFIEPIVAQKIFAEVLPLPGDTLFLF